MYHVVFSGARIDAPGTKVFDDYNAAHAYAIDRREYWLSRGENRDWEIYKIEKLWTTKSIAASRNFKA